MPQKHQLVLDFRQGLRNDEEQASVPSGNAWVLRNWIPEESGSLRPRTSWISADKTGLPATRKGRGLGVYEKGGKYLVAHAGTGTYEIWSWPQAGGAPTLLDTVTAANGTYFVSFVEGAGVILYCTPGFPSARIRKYNNTVASEAETFGVAGQTLAFHKERFWSGGVTANPTRLYYSNVLDPATWNLTTQYLEIGADDGEPIEGIESVLGGLLVAKNSSLWFVSGDGPSTFAVDRLPGGGGQAFGGKCIAVTPRGAVIAGGLMIWEWNGGVVERIGQVVGGSYSPSQGNITATYAAGKVYIHTIVGFITHVYDINRKIWYREEGDGGSDFLAGLGSDVGVLLGYPKQTTLSGLLLTRTLEGGSSLARNTDVDLSTPYELWTPRYALGGALGPATVRHLDLLVKQRGGAGIAPLDIDLNIDGAFVLTTSVSFASSGPFRKRFDLKGTGYQFDFRFVHNPGANTNRTIDIDQIVLEYETEPPR